MRRLMVLIVSLFAVAAIMGGTVAHAHRYVATPIVVLNHVDAQNQSIPVVVQIQRGQIDLGAGLVMPCGPHHAIMATGPTLPPFNDRAGPEVRSPVAERGGPERGLLRPPIAA